MPDSGHGDSVFGGDCVGRDTAKERSRAHCDADLDATGTMELHFGSGDLTLESNVDVFSKGNMTLTSDDMPTNHSIKASYSHSQ